MMSALQLESSAFFFTAFPVFLVSLQGFLNAKSDRPSHTALLFLVVGRHPTVIQEQFPEDVRGLMGFRVKYGSAMCKTNTGPTV